MTFISLIKFNKLLYINKYKNYLFKVVFVLFVVLLPFFSFAQQKIKPINISLWNPVAIGKYDSLSTTYFTFGLGQSKVHNLKGFGINGIAGKVTGNLTGVNISGVGSHVAGDVLGVSTSGLINAVSGNTKGVLIASLLNLNVGAMRGLQLGGLSSMSIGPMKGIQLSGGYNVVSSELKGIQVSAIGNITARGSNILQISGLFNMSLQSMKGIQLAAGNFADTIKGLQLGVLNISSNTRKGLQIGLVNYSGDKSGLQLGLVNVSRSSELDIMMYAGTYLYQNIAARFQNKYTYSILGLGIPYHKGGDFSGGVFYRFGVKLPIKRFSIRPDVGIYFLSVFDDDKYKDDPKQEYSLQGRLSLEYDIAHGIRVFATGGYSFTSDYGETTYTGKPIFESGLSIFLTKFSKLK